MTTTRKLRELFKKQTGINWLNSQGEPDIDYVEWLEHRIGGHLILEEKQLSNCCKASLRLGNSPYEGKTNYYVCTKCNNACDVYSKGKEQKENVDEILINEINKIKVATPSEINLNHIPLNSDLSIAIIGNVCRIYASSQRSVIGREIEFAEWILNGDPAEGAHGAWVLLNRNFTKDFYTTSELYHLFLAQTVKPQE